MAIATASYSSCKALRSRSFSFKRKRRASTSPMVRSCPVRVSSRDRALCSIDSTRGSRSATTSFAMVGSAWGSFAASKAPSGKDCMRISRCMSAFRNASSAFCIRVFCCRSV